MKKCGFCGRSFDRLWRAHCLKEEKVKYGRPEGYAERYPDVNTEPEHEGWMVTGTRTMALCEDCVNKKYILKRSGGWFMPIVLDSDWKENKDTALFETVYL